MSLLTKKINPDILNIPIGIVLVLLGVKMAFIKKPDPALGNLRTLMEIIPLLLIIFGSLLSIRAIRNLKRNKEYLPNINNDKLSNTTKVIGGITAIALIWLLVIILIIVALFLVALGQLA